MRLLLDFLPALFCVPYPLLQIHDRIQPTLTTRYIPVRFLTRNWPSSFHLTAFVRSFRTICGSCFALQVALLLSSACFGQPEEAVSPYRLLYCFRPLVSDNLRRLFFPTDCSSASLCSIFSSTNQKLCISTWGVKWAAFKVKSYYAPHIFKGVKIGISYKSDLPYYFL